MFMRLKYREKRIALRMATRLVDVFVDRPKETKRNLAKKLVKRTSMESREKPFSCSGIPSGKAVGLHYEGIFGGVGLIRVMRRPGLTKYTLAHEMMHALEPYVSNDLVLASAVGAHLENIDKLRNFPYLLYREQFEIIELGRTKLSDPGKVRPLSFFEIFNPKTEHSRGFNITGQELGKMATVFEDMSELEDIGLYFLKFVDKGLSFDEAKVKSREVFENGIPKRIRRRRSFFNPYYSTEAA